MRKSAILLVPLLLWSVAAMASVETGDGPRSSGSKSTPPATAESPKTVDLGLIVVKGKRLLTLPLPVKLQIVKAALNRPINFHQENLSKLVCRFNHDPRGAIHQPLHCETNCDILMTQNAFKNFIVPCDIGESAMLNERIAAYINSHRINRSEFMALIKRLPPPGSSYTFQVKSHGKVVARWVIEGGQVIKVEVKKKNKH